MAAYLIIVIVVVVCTFSAFLPDGYLDSLRGETLAKLGTVADTGEFLRGVDLEDITKDRGQNGRLALLNRPIIFLVGVGLNVDKGESKPVSAAC